jgi:hypothetical protein
MSTYPTTIRFELLDDGHRQRVLDAAARFGLRVTWQSGLAFAVEVPDAQTAYDFGFASGGLSRNGNGPT